MNLICKCLTPIAVAPSRFMIKCSFLNRVNSRVGKLLFLLAALHSRCSTAPYDVHLYHPYSAYVSGLISVLERGSKETRH